ncbi:MAG: 7-cyano-7-deazaguanine synthase [Deltaproteobacteria bacterium]|nr:7-cyano-7-deazaguanine synthase [Deltaproteobacteria bacterium]
MTKAVALLSGGLDSTLAVKLMLDQGIEVYALNFTSAFCTCNSGGVNKGGCKSESKRVAEEFGIDIKVMTKGLDYIEIVRNARHGYGKGMNPCVDCRIYMFKAAKEYMREIGAEFIITGEVLGQRPMSQRKDAFRIIEAESGLEGLILRPLSAKQLEPSIPEKTGLVDREKLLDVLGRSRRQQIDLAEELDVNDYPCPSGGCLLTDKIFSKKVRDLLANKEAVTKKDLTLLKAGRHFRYNGVKIVVGKNEADNTKLKALVQPGDTLIEPADFPGPVAIAEGGAENGSLQFAGSLILRYALEKATGKKRLRATRENASEEFEVSAPADEKLLEEARIC